MPWGTSKAPMKCRLRRHDADWSVLVRVWAQTHNERVLWQVLRHPTTMWRSQAGRLLQTCSQGEKNLSKELAPCFLDHPES